MTQEAAPPMQDNRTARTHSRPALTIHHGQSQNANDAAWAMIADAAEEALGLPGLSQDGRRLIAEATVSCRLAAGQDDSAHLVIAPRTRGVLTLVVDR
jgi:hypothetical protein